MLYLLEVLSFLKVPYPLEILYFRLVHYLWLFSYFRYLHASGSLGAILT